MTEKEMIESAKNDWQDMEINDVLDALEANYLNGAYDDLSGDSEAPTGHFYRIDRWIVITDSQGLRKVEEHYSEETAKQVFAEMDKEYSEWGREEFDE
jgi:hypothetical protein